MSYRGAKRERQAERAVKVPTARRGSNARGGWTNRRRFAIVAAGATVAAVVAAGFVIGRGNGPAVATPAVSGAGEVVNLSGTDPVTGRHVSLTQYRNKPVVINVWGSWCEGCKAEAADLARFQQAHPEAQVVGVDLQDSRSGAREFYRRYGWRHPSIADPNGELAARLGLQGTPSTFFLDRRHRLVTRIVGAADLAGFNAALARAEKV